MAAVGCRWPPWSVGCMVYLFLPRYIVCHDVVSAVQKILSFGTKNLRVLHFTQINPFQKNDFLYLHEKDTSTKNVKSVMRSASVSRT
jgi:hypothetical protein